MTSFISICNIDKTNMENDWTFVNLEDKYTFKFKERKKIAPLDIIYKHMLSSYYFMRHSFLMAMS